MNTKRAGFLFLLVVSVSITASLGLSVGGLFFSFEIPLILNLLLSQCIVLVPAVLFLAVFEKRPAELIHLKRIKTLDIPLIILFSGFLYPVIMLCNAISMTVVQNEVAAISDQVLACPWYIMLPMVGVIGPICEEFTFRGMIFGGLRRSGNVLGALVLQAVLFGLMHMNLNQMCYAIVIGIAMGLLVEATGSIVASCVMHIMINSSNVILMYVEEDLISGKNMQAGMDAAEQLASSPEMMLILAAFMAVPALIGLAVAGCILVAIAKRNKRLEWLGYLFCNGKKDDSRRAEDNMSNGEYWEMLVERTGMISVPLIVGMVLTVLVIILDLIAESGLGVLIKEMILNLLMRG